VIERPFGAQQPSSVGREKAIPCSFDTPGVLGGWLSQSVSRKV
jgi:hypothetical protein